VMYVTLLLCLPLVAFAVDICDSPVCPVLEDNIKAILGTREELGCCTHAACAPVEVTAACSQLLASNLQPCMQQSYEGNRSMCVQEVVGVKAPDVCQSVVEKCAGLRTIANHVQLATALSGCAVRDGMATWWPWRKCECNGHFQGPGRGECNIEAPCGHWCYVDRDNNCRDAKPSVHGSPYPWSCQACRNRRNSRKCECNGQYNHGRGECNSHWHGGAWCYINHDNNCPDARPSMRGAPFRWSYQACRNRPLGLIRSFSTDAESAEMEA